MKYKSFRNAVLSGLATIRVQEFTKSWKMTAKTMKPRWVLGL